MKKKKSYLLFLGLLHSQFVFANNDGLGNVPLITEEAIEMAAAKNNMSVQAQTKTTNNQGKVPSQQPTMPAVAPRSATTNTAPIPTAKKQSSEERRREFDTALDNQFPLTPSEIREVNTRKENVNKATIESNNPPPEPTYGSVKMNFNEHVAPVIMLDPRYNSTLSLYDKHNNPWEILSVDIGNTGAFSVSQAVSNVSTNMATLRTHSVGNTVSNMVVYVNDGGTLRALHFTLISGQDKAHYHFQVNIQKTGPNTAVGEVMVDVQNSRTFKTSEDLEEFRNGTTPTGLRELKVRSNAPEAVQAWMARDGKSIFVRTKMRPHAPAPYNVSKLPSGEYIYVYSRNYTISMLTDRASYAVTFEGVSNN